jgi:hypothetical protein
LSSLDLLNLETPIIIIETSLATEHGNANNLLAQQKALLDSLSNESLYSVRHYGDASFNNLHDSQLIDFGFLEARDKNKALEDPLPETYFEPAHKKAERLEKSIRNTERGRAQHERDRVIRLLDGLQGHDWLRIMGVSGITESRKKSFEPARDHFVKGCQSILDKFRRWTLFEKRRKQERERIAQEHAQNERAPAASSSKSQKDFTDTATATHIEDGATVGDDVSVVSDPTSDVDASIAKQLQEEVLARARVASETAAPITTAPTTTTTNGNGAKATTKRKDDNAKITKKITKRSHTKTSAAKPTSITKSASTKKPVAKAKPTKATPTKTDLVKEFTSFFEKKHERDAALSRGRRPSRKVLAWGRPIPEMPERDFELPEELKDPEIIAALARKRRRDRRAGKA